MGIYHILLYRRKGSQQWSYFGVNKPNTLPRRYRYMVACEAATSLEEQYPSFEFRAHYYKAPINPPLRVETSTLNQGELSWKT